MLPPHVDLIEGGQHCAGVLGLLQPLGDPQPHAVHLHLKHRSAACVNTNKHPVPPLWSRPVLPLKWAGQRAVTVQQAAVGLN